MMIESFIEDYDSDATWTPTPRGSIKRKLGIAQFDDKDDTVPLEQNRTPVSGSSCNFLLVSI
jgi:hypothetical protein